MGSTVPGKYRGTNTDEAEASRICGPFSASDGFVVPLSDIVLLGSLL